MKGWTKLGILLIAVGLASLVTLAGSAGARSTPRTNDDSTAIGAADDYSATQFPALARTNTLLETLAGCSSGEHSLSAPGSRLYPEMGNGGYTSLHTDLYLDYDAVANQFL